MSVRAANWGLLIGAILLACPWAVERADAAGPQTRAVNDMPVASDVRVAGDESQTRFVVDFSHKIDIRAFTLANPYRVVVDMPQVAFQLPPRTGESGRGLIKAFRFGLVMQGGSRMVLDLAKPARIEKAFVLGPGNGQPARMVLDLSAVDRASFLRAIALDNRLPGSKRAPSKPNGVATESAGDARPLIVIDPGHGGIDSGTQAASGETEKSIVLEFGRLLRDRIAKSGKYRVVMTRSDDTYVALSERVSMARARQAALFISVHADALARGDGTAQGATIYTLSERASDAAAARLAESENRADVIAGLDLSAEPDDVADILIDLARRETKTFSVQFARALVAEMRKATRLHKTPMKSAGFRVLRAPDVPSVLIELGYVSNRGDLKSLKSDAWRARTADAIAQAVDQFFARRMAGTGRGRKK
jgi:N-acetylmuramoyl-L-alanine amidase